MTHGPVFLVEDDDPLRQATAQALELAGFEVQAFASAALALKRVGRHFEGALVTDIRMSGMDGLALFEQVRTIDPDIPVILVTGHGDIAMAVRALRDGAFDFLAKPFATDHLTASVTRAIQSRALVLENRRLRHEAGRVATTIIGESEAAIDLRARVARLGRTDLDILIEGETGVGKTVIAEAIHRASPRAAEPFTSVNAAALDGLRTALEDAFEASAGGTLFLSDLANLDLTLQAILSELLERGGWRDAAGAWRARDFRVIAAARPPLEPLIAAGRLRADLFYRLATARLIVPPLRERRDDIALLFARFLQEAIAQTGSRTPELSAVDRRLLIEHDWPGNARELRNRAFAIALGLDRGGAAIEAPQGGSLAASVARYERALLVETLEAVSGHVTRAAELLETPRKTLYEKLDRYGIDPDAFRRKGG